MDKLIINHGERVTEHELGDQPVVIGRDPECDLFFADKKLSRHHARLERVGTRVRLVDLGSRNGSWVNEVRIEDREIGPGDEIRLGGLLIQVELSEPVRAPEDEESTIYLSGAEASEASEDSGTVMLDASARQSLSTPVEPLGSATLLAADTATTERPTPEESATIVFSGVAPPALPSADEGDETMKRPEPERTVVLPGVKKSPYDTGTVVFRGQADPELQEAATRLAAEEPEPPPDVEPSPIEAEPSYSSYSSLSDSMSPSTDFPVTGPSWAVRFAMVAGGLALFSFLVLALPLLRIVRVASADESARRARVLVELLAAANEQALGEGRTGDLLVDRVAGEAGVRAAYIVSPSGTILAPRDRAGENLEIAGVASLGEARNPRTATADDGDAVFLQPISYRGRRVGVALLRHRPAGAVAGGAAIALAFGTLLLIVAVIGSVLLAARMTVGPLDELRSDVDALCEGRATGLPLERPYVELSHLAVSVNRLARKSMLE